MKKTHLLLIFIVFFATSCFSGNNKLAKKILNDPNMEQVDQMARKLMKKGFYAGSGYQMVWARDLNTFIELSCEEYDTNIIRENLLMFFHFQQENGELLDGYVKKEGFTWHDPHPYYSETATGHVGFKNTVETDQETSLIQAIYKYIKKTDDYSILDEKVAGKSVKDRMYFSIDYLLNHRYSQKHGLIYGATTFDWGDIQVEGGAIVDHDELTNWSIDIYDNAMLLIALTNLEELARNKDEKIRWKKLHQSIKLKAKEHLWDSANGKFIPHIYLESSPFSAGFNENEIHVHGGTAVAIEAGLLSKAEIKTVLNHMIENVKQSGAPTIGLTIYPPYPVEELGKNVSPPYSYQNGGDWTWFGGRMIQQLIHYGYVEEAYKQATPMFDRVVQNGDFYEWYERDGKPAGSAEFKGSAGVLAKAIELFRKWAHVN